MMDLKSNKEKVEKRLVEACLTAGRLREEVNLIAVTKYVDSETAASLSECGIKHIGENRVDKFLEKYQALKEYPVTWHLIGTLQRRKVKSVINFVDYFHALDSISLAQEIDKRAEHPIKCFLQVNISGEESKHGFSEEEVFSVVKELSILENIELVGLMTMAPFDATEEELITLFSKTRALNEQLAALKLDRMPFIELSMGMTKDFPLAVANGATFVRVGTAFFD